MYIIDRPLFHKYFGNNLHFFDRLNIKFISDKAFLDYFKSQGYFFDDLSHEPVDHLEWEHRNQALKNSVFSLAMRIQMYQPDVIISCLKKKEPHVHETIRISDIQCRFYALPFPGNGHQNEYIQGLIRILGNN